MVLKKGAKLHVFIFAKHSWPLSWKWLFKGRIILLILCKCLMGKLNASANLKGLKVSSVFSRWKAIYCHVSEYQFSNLGQTESSDPPKRSKNQLFFFQVLCSQFFYWLHLNSLWEAWWVTHKTNCYSLTYCGTMCDHCTVRELTSCFPLSNYFLVFSGLPFSSEWVLCRVQHCIKGRSCF